MQEYPAGGHNAWTAAYSETRLWIWLFKQSQPLPADQILAIRRRTSAVEAVYASVEPAAGAFPEAAADGDPSTAYVAARPARAGDFLEVIYQVPLRCKQVCVLERDADSAHALAGARVDISADGLDYRPAGTIGEGRSEVRVTSIVKGVRIWLTAPSDAPLAIREIGLVDPVLAR
jgi:hypothetical protein